MDALANGKLKDGESTDGLSTVTVDKKFATFSFPAGQREWTFENPKIFKKKIRFTVEPNGNGDKFPFLNLDFLEMD